MEKIHLAKDQTATFDANREWVYHRTARLVPLPERGGNANSSRQNRQT